MLVVEFGGGTKCEEKLTCVVIRTGICHGHQTTPVAPQPRVDLILKSGNDGV